jgi:hypothetical protein
MLKTLLALAACTVSCHAQMAPWLTRAGDNARTGWNAQETVLTQSSVAARGLYRKTIIPVVGDARGMEAQPLVLPGVHTAQGVRDVMVLPSMANVVRGVDAHSGVGLWQVQLGTPINGGNKAVDWYLTNDHWGCESTGVIDPATARYYGICWSSPDGSGDSATARFYMHVLSLADGREVVPPVLLQGSVAGVDFNSQPRKMRASALLLNQGGRKTVIQCGGSVVMTKPGTGGFCFAFDTATNSFTSVLSTTQGQGANIWNSGSGPSADSSGNIYALTATGNFDGVHNFGESLLKMTYDGTLHIVDHWTPYQDQQRTGQVAEPKMLMAGMSPSTDALRHEVPVNGHAMAMPSFAGARVTTNVNARGEIVPLVFPDMAQGAWADEDLGSSGQACVMAVGVCVIAGKDGIAYPVRMDHMGATTLADLQSPKANCAKLAAPPVWLTVDPGPVDPCPTNPETLNFFPWGATAHLHMTPVQMYDPLLKSWVLFAWGENQQLHKWSISSTGQLAYIAQGHEYASADVRSEPGGGMTGGFCAGSSNGADADSMLLVCAIPYGDANKGTTSGRLLVYDPVHVGADGYLKVLWDSQRWGTGFLFNKFDVPLIDGGQVYVPNFNGGVDVYALTGN